MDGFFTSAHVVDAMIVVLLAEIVVLRLWRCRRRAGLPRGLLASFGAGLFLMLAIRLVVTGGSGPWFALLLLGAGIAHALDLRGRLAA